MPPSAVQPPVRFRTSAWSALSTIYCERRLTSAVEVGEGDHSGNHAGFVDNLPTVRSEIPVNEETRYTFG